MTTSTMPLKSDTNLQRLLLEAHVLDLLYARNKEFKAKIAAEFTAGEKHEVTNPQGLKLGSASMSSPTKKAVCIDEAVALGMATEKGMELIDHLPQPGTPEYVRAIDVLMEHAPDLLPDPTVAKTDVDALAQEVFEAWQISGKIPEGWEIRDASEPRFTVTKGRTATAKAAIAHLVGQVENILQIEAPKEES